MRLDNKHANNCYLFYYTIISIFIIYLRLQSSSIQHQNLSLKVQLKGNSTIFLKVILL